jgi:hypothetical protein
VGWLYLKRKIKNNWKLENKHGFLYLLNIIKFITKINLKFKRNI